MTISINNMKHNIGTAAVPAIAPVAVNEEFVLDGVVSTLVLPAGPYIKVEVSGLHLVLFGQELSGDFSFEKVTDVGDDGVFGGTNVGTVHNADTTVTRITLANVGLRLGTADRDFVIVSNGHGELVIVGASGGTAGGVYGDIAATVAVDIPNVAVGGTFELQLNTTTSEQTIGENEHEVTLAAQSLKVTGTGVFLQVFGQRLEGNFTFEKATDLGADGVVGGTGMNADSTVIAIAFKDVSLALGDGTTTFVTIKIDEGAVLVTNKGIAATITASVELSPALASDFVFTGSVTLELNNSLVAVDRTIEVGDLGSVTIDLPAGPYLRVQAGSPGHPVVVDVLGQHLEGVFSFEQLTTVKKTKVIRIGFTEVELFIGDDGGTPGNSAKTDDVGVWIEHGEGSLLITQLGIAGAISGTPTITLPDFSITTDLTIEFNRLHVPVNETFTFQSASGPVTKLLDLQAGPFLRVTAYNTTVTIDGHELTADFFFEQANRATTTAAITTAPATLGGSITGADWLAAKFAVGQTVTISDLAGTWTVTAVNATTLTLGNGAMLPSLSGATKTIASTLKVTKIGVAHLTYDGGALGGIENARGALVVLPKTGGGTGIAGVVLGDASAASSTFALHASIGLGINTTLADVDERIVVNGTPIVIKAKASENFTFLVNDLDFNFGDVLEIRGDFRLSGDSFVGTGLEIFVGKGPSVFPAVDPVTNTPNANAGEPNPDAIGLLIKNASIDFSRQPASTSAEGLYWLYATGTLDLIGLDGLKVSGTVTFGVNTTSLARTVTTSTGPVTLSPGVFSFIGSNIVFEVPGVFSVGGTLALTRQPNGTLEIGLVGATVSVTVNGTELFELSGSATFQISPATGFKLQTFKVNGFSVFGEPGIDAPDNSAPVLFPTADLANPVNGGKLTPADLLALSGDGDGLWVQFNDRNGAGLKELSITDPNAEFEVLINGTVTTAITVNGAAQRVLGKLNTFRYSFTVPGVLPTDGIVQIRFLPGTFSDQSGIGGAGVTNFGETEQFFLVPNENAKPRPTASLASPGSGEAITALDLNARRYIDITFTSYSGDAIDKGSITDALPEFKLTGDGVADLAVDALTGAPILVGAPLLISGLADDATTVTYRFFFKDKDKSNTIDLFKPGTVTVEFLRNDVAGYFFRTVGAETNPDNGSPNSGGETPPGSARRSRSTPPLREPSPATSRSSSGRCRSQPDDRNRRRRLLRRDARPDDRHRRRPGGARHGQAQPTGPGATTTTSNVGAAGVERPHRRPARHPRHLRPRGRRLRPAVRQVPHRGVPGKFGLRVSSLEAVVPDVVDRHAEGIEIKYDPAGDRDPGARQDQQRHRLLPEAQRARASIKPYDPTIGHNVDDTGQTTGVIPGPRRPPERLHDRHRRARVRDRQPDGAAAPAGPRAGAGTTPPATPPAAQSKITLRLDPRVRRHPDRRPELLRQLRRREPGRLQRRRSSSPPAASKLFPGKPFSATITDRQTADDVNPDGTPERRGAPDRADASRTARSTSFQVERRHARAPARHVRHASPPATSSSTRAPGDNEELVSFDVGRREGQDRLARDRRRGAQLRLPRRRHLRDEAGLRRLPERRVGDRRQLQVAALAADPDRRDRDPVGRTSRQHPEDFVLTLSASVTGIKGIAGARVLAARSRASGSSRRCSPQGKFPIIDIDSIGVTVKGKHVRRHDRRRARRRHPQARHELHIIGTFDNTTPVVKRVFFVGIQGGFTHGRAWAASRSASACPSSARCPAFINVELPSGIMLVPQIGLVAQRLRRRRRVLQDAAVDRRPVRAARPEFGLPTAVTADTVARALQQQVAQPGAARSSEPRD